RKERNSRATAVNKFEQNSQRISISGYQEEYSANVCPGPLRRGLRARAEAPHPPHTSDRIRNASLVSEILWFVPDLVTNVKYRLDHRDALPHRVMAGLCPGHPA